MASADILVVEDERIVAMDIRNTLMAHGYNVIDCVSSGEEAIERVKETCPDLVLMDIRLQGEMDGIEAARIMRESFHVPSLFLTSHADRDMLQRAKDAEAVGYVLKPFEERELEVAVEMALHRIQVEKKLRKALHAAIESVGEDSKPEEGNLLHPPFRSDAMVPLLQIRTLGRIEISSEGKVIVRAEDLSRAQRELLAMVLSAPQCQISREEVQTALWPDSSPEKARSSFDSLLLRLRKTIDGLDHPKSTMPYISLQKGILSLKNCRVDAAEFVNNIKKGLQYSRRREFSLAEKTLSAALRLWNGSFMLGACGSENAYNYKEELERLFVDGSLCLSEVLFHAGRLDEAVQVVRRALNHDRVNDDLVRALCRLLRKGEQQAQVNMVIRQYEEALKAAGYSTVEIAEIIEDITP